MPYNLITRILQGGVNRLILQRLGQRLSLVVSPAKVIERAFLAPCRTTDTTRNSVIEL
jgi:hypothetical protein